MSYNGEVDRTFRIDGALSIAGMVAQFIQNMNISFNAGVFQRDSTGTGQSVFTQNSDIIGGFSFSLKNTITLYDPADTPALEHTISAWMNSIAKQEPIEISFIQTVDATKASGIKTAMIEFTGRIMKAELVTSVDDGIEDVNVEGEIMTFVSAQRKA